MFRKWERIEVAVRQRKNECNIYDDDIEEEMEFNFMSFISHIRKHQHKRVKVLNWELPLKRIE